MKRLLKIGFLIGLAIPSTVFAQGAGPGAGQGGIAIPEPLGPTYAAGVVRGSVTAMNLAAGTIRVRTGTRVVTLQATPSQLAGLNPGDLVQFPYVNYEGVVWLSPVVGGGRAAFYGTYGNQGRITGAVQGMARGAGSITVRGARFRIHPAQLQGVLPGMFVNVIYADIGGVNWVAAITPAGGAPGGAGLGGMGGGLGGPGGGAGFGGAGGGPGMGRPGFGGPGMGGPGGGGIGPGAAGGAGPLR